jgi:hypothetical protein
VRRRYEKHMVENNVLENTTRPRLQPPHVTQAAYRLHPSHVDSIFFDLSMATVLYSLTRRCHDAVYEDTYSLHPDS